ncbi:MAG: metallophosphoesterase [Acetivibrionales bacterium]|jgi:predicted MPP superfamily phosphohydrolase
MFKGKRKFYYIIALVLLVVFYYWQNHTLQITRYEFAYENLPRGFDGYRIVQISDMHGKTFGRNNIVLANRIKRLKPDLLLVTGDMISSTMVDEDAFFDFLDQFDKACPVYLCLGNHEQIVRQLSISGKNNDRYRNFIDNISKKGAVLLDNEKTNIKNGEDVIVLSGLSLELYHYTRRDIEPYDENLSLTKSYIEGVLGSTPEGFKILLAHNPAYFDEYVSWGADLILAGHIHGGIIRIPFLGGLFSPDKIFFPEFDAGLFEKGKSKMIVNRGLGCLGYSKINIRLFNRPEITFIELLQKQ